MLALPFVGRDVIEYVMLDDLLVLMQKNCQIDLCPHW